MSRSRSSSSCFGAKKPKLDDEGSPNTNKTIIPRNGFRASNIVCPEMCFYCFDVLHRYLNRHAPPRPPTAFPNSSYPLFVTWTDSKDESLRGCIGTFNAMSIHNGLKEYAITSALRDSRFSPITEAEFPRLTCSVSLLLHFEEGKDYLDWQIGVHGIRIDFTNERGCQRTATYLPEVAHKQGWNHLETIDSLLRKGGYRGAINESTRRSVRLTRYRSEKLSVPAWEYLEARQNGFCY